MGPVKTKAPSAFVIFHSPEVTVGSTTCREIGSKNWKHIGLHMMYIKYIYIYIYSCEFESNTVFARLKTYRNLTLKLE